MRGFGVLGVLVAVVLSGCGEGAGSSGSSNGGTSAGGGGAGGTTNNGGTSGGGTSNGGTSSGGSTTSSSTSSSTSAADLCASAGSTPISFASDVQPIFSQSCGGVNQCHMKALPSEGLSLKAGEAYGDLVNVPAKQSCSGKLRVTPGDADESYLVDKIRDTGVCAGEKKMPPNSSISQASVQKIIDWICQGAANN